MNKFTVTYPNGIKRHINKQELTLLRPSLRQISLREFSAESLSRDLEQSNGPDFFAGQFIIEYPKRLGGRKVNERLESPKGMIARLGRMRLLEA
jgi:hypothetical protein